MKKIILLLILFSFTISMSAVVNKEKAMKKPVYTVDFKGANYAFMDVRTGEPPTGLYAAGDSVMFIFVMRATDTDYSFFLDGESIYESYHPEYGYCFQFMMPDHDVKFIWTSRNTMLYDPSEMNKNE